MRYATLQQPWRSGVALLTLLTCLLAFTGAWATGISVSTSSLTGFTTQQGSSSQVKSYTFTANDLTPPAANPDFNVTVAGTGFEISTSQNGPFATTIPLNLSSGGNLSQVIFVRIKASATQGSVSGTINHFLNVSPAVSTPVVLLSGAVSAPPLPIFGFDPGSLSGFTTKQGIPSEPKTYLITASRFPPQTSIELRIPGDDADEFQLSVNAQGPYGPLTFIKADNNGNIQRTVFVRLKASATPGAKTAILVHSIRATDAPLGEVQLTGTVTAVPANQPRIFIEPDFLDKLDTTPEQSSAPKSFVINGQHLPGSSASLQVLSPAGFNVSEQASGPFSTSLTIQLAIQPDGTAQKTLFVRLKGETLGGVFGIVQVKDGGDLFDELRVEGTVKDVPAQPVLLVDPTSLSGFTTNGSAPSQIKQYQLTGSGLTSSNGSVINLSLAAPAGFEIQLDGTSFFSDSQGISGNGTATINVRLKSGLAPGNYSGNITHSNPDITTVNLAVSGTVTGPPTTSVNLASLAGFTTNQGTPSAPKAFTISGTNLPVSNPAIIAVSAQAPAGYEVATLASGPFSDQLQTLTGVAANGTGSRELFVRLKGTATGPINGTVTAQMGSITPSTLSVSGVVSPASGGPDLTTTLSLPQASFAPSGANSVRNFIVEIFETGGQPTASGKAAITLTAPVGYSLSFTTSLNSINVSGGSNNPISVDNTQWLVTTNQTNQQFSLTMKAGQLIGAKGKATLGFTITRTTANTGSSSNITVNVNDDASKSYDGDSSNNIYSRIVTGL
ncbi:autotransporter outer membrane beta-barrel domain-containing protein [Spirosoma areae]